MGEARPPPQLPSDRERGHRVTRPGLHAVSGAHGHRPRRIHWVGRAVSCTGELPLQTTIADAHVPPPRGVRRPDDERPPGFHRPPSASKTYGHRKPIGPRDSGRPATAASAGWFVPVDRSCRGTPMSGSATRHQRQIPHGSGKRPQDGPHPSPRTHSVLSAQSRVVAWWSVSSMLSMAAPAPPNSSAISPATSVGSPCSVAGWPSSSRPRSAWASIW